MSNRTKFNQSGRVGSQSIPGTNRWILFAVVFLAMSFNFILCFLNTNVVPITRLYVQLSEGFIISSALIISFRNIRLSEYVFIAGVSLYSILMILIRAATSVDGSIDVQPIRDLIIPVAFYLLGTRARSIRDVDKIVALSAILVAIDAAFEFFFLDTYLKFFNIIQYYIARGTVSVQETVYLANELWVSGIRPEGRSLLPFLGDQRVSSIFLEPVSPGNFAVILFFWATIRSASEKRIDYLLFGISLFLTVMSDNRFGLTTCALGLCVYILAAVSPKAIVSSVLMILPFAAIGLLMVIAYTYSNLPIDDSFLGRAISSGNSLFSMDFLNWLGFHGPKNVTSSFDSGYTYAVGIIGITGFSVLWLTFLTIKAPGPQFFLFRTLSAFYLALILCVSYSPFTIKTAALLWFLLGALAPRNTAQLSEQSRSTNLRPPLGYKIPIS
jgi:putative polymerase